MKKKNKKKKKRSESIVTSPEIENKDKTLLANDIEKSS